MNRPPERPLLSKHVLARRHVVDGTSIVVLHDVQRSESHRVAEKSWQALLAMDGTRDVTGIALRASRYGVAVSTQEVLEFVEQLASLSMIEEGAARFEPPAAGATAAPALVDRVETRDLPLAELEGFALRCDGQGSCCRFYPSVVFRPLEAARARARLPLVAGAGLDPGRGFLPLVGEDEWLLAVTLIDGRCAYLESDDRCGIHRAGSGSEKPLGCRVYPARFMSDGETVRVTPWLECACVFASGCAPPLAGSDSGASLVPDGATSSAALDPSIHIERLPEEVHVGALRVAPAAELRAWSRDVSQARITDPVAGLFALAEVLDGPAPLEVERCRAALESTEAVASSALSPWLEALTRRSRKLAAEDWRSTRDLARQVAGSIVAACELCEVALDDLVGPAARFARDEAFYVRASIFGHQLVHPRRSMATVARDRALRIVIGRALAVVSELAEIRDPAFRHPLGLVEATMRAHGLSVYVDDVGQPATL